MAGTFVVNGNNVKIKFEYVASIAKAQETVNQCAKAVYAKYPITEIYDGIDVLTPFEALTNQQKLDVVDKFVISEIIKNARQIYRQELLNEAMALAKEDADTSADENLITP